MREAHDETPGEYVANASRRFASRASDEDWLALMNAMERAETPGRAAIAHMVQWAVTADEAERAASGAPHGDPAEGGCGSGSGSCGCGTR